MIEAVQTGAAHMPPARPFNVANGHLRAIVNLTRAMETAVSRDDTLSALLALETLRDVLGCHFAREERAMEALPGYDVMRHAHDHQALLSGLCAMHGAIVAKNFKRLNDLVAAYINRAARHAIEHDVPLSEHLDAA